MKVKKKEDVLLPKERLLFFVSSNLPIEQAVGVGLGGEKGKGRERERQGEQQIMGGRAGGVGGSTSAERQASGQRTSPASQASQARKVWQVSLYCARRLAQVSLAWAVPVGCCWQAVGFVDTGYWTGNQASQ